MNQLTALCMVAALSLWACDQKAPEPDKAPPSPAPASAKPTPGTDTQPAKSAGEITWKKPDAWKEATNPSPMRKATYSVPKADGDSEDGELSVSAAGGTLEANVERWKGQFEGSPDPKQSEKEVAGMKVTVIELAGTYKGGGPMMGAGSSEPKKDWIMLAAVVHTTPQMHFFKLTGPKKTVEAARADFDVLLGSITAK